jgi:hypothetical protein
MHQKGAVYDPQKTGKGGGGGTSWDGGAGGGLAMINNTSQSGKRHQRNQPEMGKIAKRDMCKLFC